MPTPNHDLNTIKFVKFMAIFAKILLKEWYLKFLHDSMEFHGTPLVYSEKFLNVFGLLIWK